MFVDLPNISPNSPPNLMIEEIRRYVYKSNEQINLALADCSVEKMWEKTEAALSSVNSGGVNLSEVEQHKKRFANLRDLIIKSADEVFSEEEVVSRVLNGRYIAKSGFGNFLLNTRLEVLESSKTINELFTYAAAANEYKIYNRSEITRGLLDDSDPGNPIYGLQIGLLEYQFLKDENDNYVLDEHGNRIIIDKATSNRFLRLTSDRLSLLNGNTEVAYISEDNIYFPKAHITGGSINLNNKFKVTSAGKLNIGDYFSVNENGFARMRSADLYYQTNVNNIWFYEENTMSGDPAATITLDQSSYTGASGTRNYGLIINGVFYTRIGNHLINNSDDAYKSGIEKGVYVEDGLHNLYKARTATITIGSTTLQFRDGLLVGSAIPLNN